MAKRRITPERARELNAMIARTTSDHLARGIADTRAIHAQLDERAAREKLVINDHKARGWRTPEVHTRDATMLGRTKKKGNYTTVPGNVWRERTQDHTRDLNLLRRTRWIALSERTQVLAVAYFDARDYDPRNKRTRTPGTYVPTRVEQDRALNLSIGADTVAANE